jgi:hypothetical protein
MSIENEVPYRYSSMKSVMKKIGEAAEAVAAEQLFSKARRGPFGDKKTCHR